MSPSNDIVCECPCSGCLFQHVCWKLQLNELATELSMRFAEHNFCADACVYHLYD